MVAELIAVTVFILVIGAELIHSARVRRLAQIAFGPEGRPSAWVHAVPFLRAVAVAAMTWGFVTLLYLNPKVHRGEALQQGEKPGHILIILDVSPSMRIEDAGPELKLGRRRRAQHIMDSFFNRVPMEQHRVSVVAFYNDAKPVVVDTEDIEVIRNILDGLPLDQAFVAGETDLFAGLEEAIRIAKPWEPRSTMLLVITDGDTIPATGMPRLPASVRDVLVVGLGDPTKGAFIDGHQSRQDTATLRQMAVRLGGTYHNGNESHISTATLKRMTGRTKPGVFEKLTKREYALIACGVGSLIFATLPILLHFFGTAWRPGTQVIERRVGTREKTTA